MASSTIHLSQLLCSFVIAVDIRDTSHHSTKMRIEISIKPYFAFEPHLHWIVWPRCMSLASLCSFSRLIRLILQEKERESFVLCSVLRVAFRPLLKRCICTTLCTQPRRNYVPVTSHFARGRDLGPSCTRSLDVFAFAGCWPRILFGCRAAWCPTIWVFG